MTFKVHIVDGSFEVFRCFYGAPRRENAEGREIGGSRGFLWTMRSLLRQDDVTHVAVAFDAVVNTERLDQMGETELLTSQIPIAQEICRALGIRMWPIVRYQADDALATAAARYKSHPDVQQVVLCSSDNDFAQCVDGARVVLLNRITDVLLDEDGVVEKFGVLPKSIPDYLALVGDPSDGIPGFPGWGKKSTATVLRRYEHIEMIPEDVEQWDVKVRGAARLSDALESRRSEAIMHRDLSILFSDMPLSDDVEDLQWECVNAARLAEILALLELDSDFAI